MVLADTSVLIGYLKNREGVPYEKMDYIIDNDIPYGICDYVYLELLQGAGNGREYQLLKEYLGALPFYNLKNERYAFENAALIYSNCRKKGITIRSTIDLIIAEIAIENNVYLLHDDNDFSEIAKVYENLKMY